MSGAEREEAADMARRGVSSRLLLGAAVCLALCSAALAQMGDPFKDWTPEGVGSVRSDLPYIQCDVCKKVSEKLISSLAEKRKRATKRKPVGELDIIELTEKICDRKTADGGWILQTDMEEDGDRIKLVEYDYEGECANECRTIQKACETVMDSRDTDVAEALQKPGMSQEALETLLCHEMTDSCASPPPPLPPDRKPGEKFEKPKPKDYGKMAEEMGIKSSVMHDPGDNYEIPEGLPVLPPPKHLTDPPKKKAKASKKKKKSKAESDWESMSEL